MAEQSEKQLLVLGNGFDLAAGIKSGYKSFIEYILKQQELNSHDTDYEETIKQVGFNIQYEADIKTETYTNIWKLNPWYWVLLTYKMTDENYHNWFDIELTIKNFLESDVIKHFLDENFPINKSLQKFSLDSLIRIKLLQLIFKHEKSDMDFKNVSLKKVYEWLYTKLNQVESDFETYIKEKLGTTANSSPTGSVIDYEISLLNKILNADNSGAPHKRNLLNKIFNAYNSGAPRKRNFSYNILNFNYTNIFTTGSSENFPEDVQHSLISTPRKTLNIHGLINKEKNDSSGSETYSHIIFGIDNKSIDSSDPIYIFTKTYRTLLAASDQRQEYNQEESDIFDKDIKVIKFFGHSLSDADYSYFQQMFDFYDIYHNQDIKLYFYFQKYPPYEEFELARQQVERVVKLIETYGKTMTNKSHGKNLLTKLQATKRIFIKAI